LQDGSIILEEFFHAGGLADLGECSCSGDSELVKMTVLLLLGLWRRLADVKIEKPIEFVSGKGGIDLLNLFLLVVKYGDFVFEFFYDFRDDCLGLASINGWSFFGLGSEFQFQNQGIGISVHWGTRGKVASGDSDIIIVACGGWGGFLRTGRREKGHVNVHG
jgi:hypothetical protein